MTSCLNLLRLPFQIDFASKMANCARACPSNLCTLRVCTSRQERVDSDGPTDVSDRAVPQFRSAENRTFSAKVDARMLCLMIKKFFTGLLLNEAKRNVLMSKHWRHVIGGCNMMLQKIITVDQDRRRRL